MTLREWLHRWRKPALSEEEREERRQTTARLAAALREEIRRRFPKTTMLFHSDEEWGDWEFVVNIPCPSGAIGDLDLVTDDSEATLFVEGMTHGHFTAYGPVDAEVYEAASKAERDEIVAISCCEFLEALFDDKVVVWAAADGGSDGWYWKDSPRSSVTTVLLGDLLSKSKSSPEKRAGTWSAPYPASE